MNANNSRTNSMRLEFDSYSENESFARVTVAAFCTRLDPTIEEIADIKTAVSEAVTNSIVHGYADCVGKVMIECSICENIVTIVVKDSGVGIENLEMAMEPMYTTKPELDRSGMGFSFMEAFMDTLDVKSEPGMGTVVTMTKKIDNQRED